MGNPDNATGNEKRTTESAAPFLFFGTSTRAAEVTATYRSEMPSPFSAATRSRLLPREIVAPLRRLAVDFLSLSTLKQLLLVAVANRLKPSEAGCVIANAVEQFAALLDRPDAEREATLAETRARIDRTFSAFALILSQIDPARRGIFREYYDGRTVYNEAAAATARATTCQRYDEHRCGSKKTRKANVNAAKRATPPPPFRGIIECKVCACHNCKNGVGQHCITCRRINQDDIRIKRNPHNINPELTKELTTSADAGKEPELATPINPNAEDVLRLMLATFAALSPLELLLVIHSATRRAYPFEEYLRTFVDKIQQYENDDSGRMFSRATLKAAWESIAAKNPAFAVLRSWKYGNDPTKNGKGRKKRDKDGATVAEEVTEDGETTDTSRDRAEPFGRDRDDDTTRYFFDDGSGTDW